MTDKKENILLAALELFANEGYSATPTSKIAKKAGVSEGLIFRHFENKKGLLEAIMADAEVKIREFYAPIIFEEDPDRVIRRMIELPFEFSHEGLDFWKLQFKLKWQSEYNNPEKLKPILDKLTWAFEKKGYESPEKEAEMLNQILEMLSTNVLRDGKELDISYRDFLLKKFNV